MTETELRAAFAKWYPDIGYDGWLARARETAEANGVTFDELISLKRPQPAELYWQLR